MSRKLEQFEMAMKPKQSELDIIPTLDDVVSLGKIKKYKNNKSDGQLKTEPILEAEDESNTASATPELLSPEHVSEIQTIIENIIDSKLKTIRSELSNEIGQGIIDYLKNNKSSD